MEVDRKLSRLSDLLKASGNISEASELSQLAKTSSSVGVGLQDVADKTSTIDVGYDDVIKLLKSLPQLLGKFYNKSSSIFVWGFVRFLLGVESPATEADIPSKYLQTLAKMAEWAAKNAKGHVGGGQRAYEVYYGKMKAALRQGDTTVPSVATKGDLRGTKSISDADSQVEDIMYFLGQFHVQDIGSAYVIKDFYDFNEASADPAFYSKMSNLVGTIKTEMEHVANKPSQHSVYTMIRRIAAYRQGTGYKGYPIVLTLPKSLLA